MNPVALTVSADQLADLLGVTRKTIGQYQSEGIITRLPGGQARYDCRAAVRGVAGHLRKGAAHQSSNKSAKEISLIEGGLWKQVNRKIAELKLEAEKANLLPREAVQEQWVKNAAAFKNAVLDIPTRIGSAMKLSASDRKRVEAICDGTLAELSEAAIHDGT